MKHCQPGRKFGRPRNQRRSLLCLLADGLIRHGRIKTTEAKAKETRRFIEPLVSRAKKGNLADRRLLLSRLGSAAMAKILLEKIGPRFKERKGGYTRLVKLPRRRGDGAAMAVIEFV